MAFGREGAYLPRYNYRRDCQVDCAEPQGWYVNGNGHEGSSNFQRLDWAMEPSVKLVPWNLTPNNTNNVRNKVVCPSTDGHI